MTSDSFSLNINGELIRGLIERRDAMRAEIEELDAKLKAIRVLLPEAGDLIGLPKDVQVPQAPRSQSKRPLAERSMTDLVMWAMRDEKGGRSSGAIRAKLETDPALAKRIYGSPTGLGNALTRLHERGLLIKVGRAYYLPEIYSKIQSGELEEERLENDNTKSFNSVMHEVMRRFGRPFTASQAISCASADEFLAEKLREQPSRAYSWLSRELYKHKLIKVGDAYVYPDQQGAQTASNSSSLFDNANEGGADVR